MSVTTRADEKLAEARDYIREARKCLSEALNPDTWGAEEFKDIYVNDLHDFLKQLSEMSSKL